LTFAVHPLVASTTSTTVTWIKVDKPVFDLVGVVLYSLGLAGICAGIALALGVALGVAFILRARRTPPEAEHHTVLHLAGPGA
jgi:hypothetical protein